MRALEQKQKQKNAEFIKAVSGSGEHAKAMLQGYAPGQYVRVLLEGVPPEFSNPNPNPTPNPAPTPDPDPDPTPNPTPTPTPDPNPNPNQVPPEFCACFDPRFPVIVGGLRPGEEKRFNPDANPNKPRPKPNPDPNSTPNPNPNGLPLSSLP